MLLRMYFLTYVHITAYGALWTLKPDLIKHSDLSTNIKETQAEEHDKQHLGDAISSIRL